jgi:hypothetical protein
MELKAGKVIEPAHCNIRDHERRTAKAIAATGLVVEFVPESTRDLTKSPDIIVEGLRWEMKSPKTDKWNQIQNNLKKANRQSKYIIIDSQRIKHLPDKSIQNFLLERYKKQKSIKRLLFVNRKRQVIDIANLV